MRLNLYTTIGKVRYKVVLNNLDSLYTAVCYIDIGEGAWRDILEITKGSRTIISSSMGNDEDRVDLYDPTHLNDIQDVFRMTIDAIDCFFSLIACPSLPDSGNIHRWTFERVKL